jgi:hypothetical protein
LPSHRRGAWAQWLLFLSGLTCTEDNFMHKAGALRGASRLGLALVTPDTSPRGHGVPGEADTWQFGVGAGFYLNATVPQWRHWRMYDYVADELPALVTAHLPLVCSHPRARACTHGCTHTALTRSRTPVRIQRACPSLATRWAASAHCLWRCATRASSRCVSCRPFACTGASTLTHGPEGSPCRRLHRSRTRHTAPSAATRLRATWARTRPRGPRGTRPPSSLPTRARPCISSSTRHASAQGWCREHTEREREH